MQTVASSDALLQSHLEHVADDEVRRAAIVLIRYIEAQSGATGEANLHGVIRAYKYMIGVDNPLAFIFNRESLLFYVRNPALRLPAVATLVESWVPGEGLTANRNPAGELTTKVTSEAQARSINATLVGHFLGSTASKRPCRIRNTRCLTNSCPEQRIDSVNGPISRCRGLLRGSIRSGGAGN